MDDQQINNTNKLKNSDIEALEKLLNQSVRGLHHLFDKQQITEILKTPTEELDFFTVENMTLIQKLFDELIKKDTFQSKLAYIERLDKKKFEMLLRTYFHIVESTIISSNNLKH